MASKKFWIYYNSSNLSSDFCVDEFGWHDTEAGYSFSEKRINHLFQFVLKGECRLTVGEPGKQKEYVVRAGEAFLVRAGTPHTYTSDTEKGCGRYWLSISGNRVDEALRRCGILDGQVVLEGVDTAELTKRYHSLYKCIRKDEENAFKILSHVTALLDMVRRTRKQKVEIEETAFTDRQLIVKAVMQYIKNNLSENSNVKEIANKFGYERSHLYRLFLEENGFSIQRYIIACRMNRARNLLVETDMPIYQIAHEVGYESYAAFSKIFIRETGCSPSTHRKYNTYKKS